MSHVDTKLTPDERDAFLDEVRTQLPAFLSSDAAEIADPVGDVGELLNLSAGDLRKVVAVHLGLSDQVRAFLAGLRAGLRQPLTSSERPRVATQAVRGPIDWGSTIRHRALVGGDTSVFVVRPAQRVFDIPENRALVWLLVGLDHALRRVSTAQMDPTAGVHDPGWIAELATTRARLQQAQRFHWLRGIPAQRPDAWTSRVCSPLELGATSSSYPMPSACCSGSPRIPAGMTSLSCSVGATSSLAATGSSSRSSSRCAWPVVSLR